MVVSIALQNFIKLFGIRLNAHFFFYFDFEGMSEDNQPVVQQEYIIQSEADATSFCRLQPYKLYGDR